jgi:uncharacterized protein YqgQ
MQAHPRVLQELGRLYLELVLSREDLAKAQAELSKGVKTDTIEKQPEAT